MVVHHFLSRHAEQDPDAVAVIESAEPARGKTYRDLDVMANKIANTLGAEGVGPGDRIVLALKNGVESVASYFGALKAGAVAVPLSASPGHDGLTNVIQDCAPAACIIDREMAARKGAEAALNAVPLILIGGTTSAAAGRVTGGRELEAAIEGASPMPPADTVTGLDLAAIIYTSGSTGQPRGVMLTHRNIVANTRSIVAYLHLDREDRGMCVLPLHYAYGLSLLHTHMAVGGSLVLENRFVFPNVVLEALREHRVTGFAGVPSTFALLLHRSALREMTFPDLRYVTQAGGHMAPVRIVQWLEQGPQVPFYVMYGATEASARLTYLDPKDLRRKLGSIGKPIPDVDIRVLTDTGEEAAPGETGELVATGENISPGYWNDATATLERFGPSGYRTGDIGYRDEEGFLFLMGRRHDMIKAGAHRIGSSEVEDVLHQHPDVLEAAVVGVPHDLLGEAPVAFVSPRPGATLEKDALLAYCRSRLPPHKRPLNITIVSELPKTATGKIDRTSLRRSASDQGTRGNRRGDEV